MSAADDLCATSAERSALARLRELSGEPSGSMERHCVRCFLLADELARRDGRDIDREVLLVAAFLHDGGLYLDDGERGTSYVTDGRRFAADIGDAAGWDETRITRCADAIEHHHDVRRQWRLGAEVELLRRTDLAEIVPPLGPMLGFDRALTRRVARIAPRRGLYRLIVTAVLGEIRHHGLRTTLRIFRPPAS